MTDKLAEEIIEKKLKGAVFYGAKDGIDGRQLVINAMQAYHEATNKQITDKDIERQVKQINRREALCTVDYYSTGFIAGAKAMRDGKIKHKEE
jgi:hypothetical protein